jgi:hypothetical protein
LSDPTDEPPATLAKALADTLEVVFRDHLLLVGCLARELCRSLRSLLRFLEEFMRRHIEEPCVVEEFLALLQPSPDGRAGALNRQHVVAVLDAYRRQFDGPAEVIRKKVEEAVEGNRFAVVLQGLHHDCERLQAHYRELRLTDLYQCVGQLGDQARRVEQLLGRVANRLLDLVVDEIFVEEVLRLLRTVVEARGQVVRYSDT